MGEKISFICTHCNAENWINLGMVSGTIGKKPLPLVCGKCCLLNNGKNFGKKKPSSGDWIECIPYEGILKDFPVGSQKVAGITKYTDAKGKIMTREEFVMTHGVDPKCYLLQVDEIELAFHSGRPAKDFKIKKLG